MKLSRLALLLTIASSSVGNSASGAQEFPFPRLESTLEIRLASIMVEDQEQALAFYTDVLRFVKKQVIPIGRFRWLTVVSRRDPDGAELVLEPDVGTFNRGSAKEAKAMLAGNSETNACASHERTLILP